MANSNERRVTLNGLIWGAALREMPFLHAAALFFADVHSAHCARNALLRIKNGYFATTGTSVKSPYSL
ncbi:MAG: hypothetical protein Q9M08_04025, partial [Mariprofundus sp.]|nr:hypothetical protein [Mariprofundus sp.]